MKKGFVVHWNGPAANCLGQSHSRCVGFWAAVKRYHVETKGWSDIAYSFGVCPHGTVLEGRGWNKNQFANGADVVGPDDGADRYWYTVLTFIGTGEKPTPAMVNGVRDLIDQGRAWGRCLDRVLPHNAFKVKTCPGPEFTALTKDWDNHPFGVAPAPGDANAEANTSPPGGEVMFIRRKSNDKQALLIVNGKAVVAHNDAVVPGDNCPIYTANDDAWNDIIEACDAVLD